MQDFEKALADADRAIELDSSYLLAYYMRVQIRMKNQEVRMAEKSEVPSAGEVKWTFDASRSEYQAALDDCDRILAREPDFAGCYYNKGNIYMQLKLWPEAIKAYTQAIKLHVDYAEAYYNRRDGLYPFGRLRFRYSRFKSGRRDGLI